MRSFQIVCLLIVVLAAGCGDPYREGMGLINKGEYSKAAQYFSMQVDKHPNDPRAYNQLGYCYTRLKKYGPAGKAYLKALELKPDYFEAELNLGTVQLYKNEWDTAEEHLKKALALKPDSEPAHVNLAWVYYHMSRFDEALQQVKKAVELSRGRRRYLDVIKMINKEKERSAKMEKPAETAGSAPKTAGGPKSGGTE